MRLTIDLVLILVAIFVLLAVLFRTLNPCKLHSVVLWSVGGLLLGYVAGGAIELYLHATGRRHYELHDKPDGSRVWEIKAP